MKENQRSITYWADETFGYAASDLKVWERFMDEVRELEAAMYVSNVAAGRECADVLITLYRLADYLHVDLNAEVDRKMAINRARKWHTNGDGTGQHIEEDV